MQSPETERNRRRLVSCRRRTPQPVAQGGDEFPRPLDGQEMPAAFNDAGDGAGNIPRPGRESRRAGSPESCAPEMTSAGHRIRASPGRASGRLRSARICTANSSGVALRIMSTSGCTMERSWRTSGCSRGSSHGVSSAPRPCSNARSISGFCFSPSPGEAGAAPRRADADARDALRRHLGDLHGDPAAEREPEHGKGRRHLLQHAPRHRLDRIAARKFGSADLAARVGDAGEGRGEYVGVAKHAWQECQHRTAGIWHVVFHRKRKSAVVCIRGSAAAAPGRDRVACRTRSARRPSSYNSP